MVEICKIVVSLSFFGDDLDPDEISRWLVNPTKVASKILSLGLGSRGVSR